jgi:hypothetical protein
LFYVKCVQEQERGQSIAEFSNAALHAGAYSTAAGGGGFNQDRAMSEYTVGANHKWAS